MHIVIIGNGIAGITAARTIRKLSDHEITVISAETDYFFARTALMYVYMGQLRYEDIKPYENWFWTKNRIQLRRAFVQKIDTQRQQLILDGGPPLPYDKLLVASGSVSGTLQCEGSALDGVQGLYSYQDLELMEEQTRNIKRAVVAGGGLIGVELAEMLHSRNIHVTLLIREKSYWGDVLPQEESAVVNKHLLEHGIDLRLETEISKINGNSEGKVVSVTTRGGETIPCEFAGIAVGVKPNVAFLADSEIQVKRGILVDEYLRTNVAGIYAAGDCAEVTQPQKGRRSIEAVWYAARNMGEVAGFNLCGVQKTYAPGFWYNSAKFFDIEYQTYGEVPLEESGNYQSVYWEHPSGKKSIRIVFNPQSGVVRGFNLMGVRYRQEVCEKWMREKTTVEVVLENLGLANFDPEFYKEYESDIIDIYNKKYGKNLKLKRKRGLPAVLRFLRQPSTGEKA